MLVEQEEEDRKEQEQEDIAAREVRAASMMGTWRILKRFRVWGLGRGESCFHDGHLANLAYPGEDDFLGILTGELFFQEEWYRHGGSPNRSSNNNSPLSSPGAGSIW
jgi:hypothetical protein